MGESIKVWKIIFSMAKSIDLKKPLTTKILSDPENEFVQTLLYIYSMESFVFKEMNKATRDKDITKIEYYGPYASALGYVIHSATKKRNDNQCKKQTLYRGFNLEKKEIKDYYVVGQ